MNETATRLNLSLPLSACILAAGLVAAALILAHRPSGPTPARPRPPIAQEAAARQFRTQVLAAPDLHIFQDSHGGSHTLTDVRVSLVIYSAKDDTFTIAFRPTWQPALPASYQQDDDYSVTLGGDGYGHYMTPVSLTMVDGLPHPNDHVTIQ